MRLSCDPMDCSPPAFSVHGTSQARMLGERSHSRGLLTQGLNVHLLTVKWILYPPGPGKSIYRCVFPNTNVYQNSLSGVNCIINVHWVIGTLVIYLGFLPHAANIKENTCPWRKGKLKSGKTVYI